MIAQGKFLELQGSDQISLLDFLKRKFASQRTLDVDKSIIESFEFDAPTRKEIMISKPRRLTQAVGNNGTLKNHTTSNLPMILEHEAMLNSSNNANLTLNERTDYEIRKFAEYLGTKEFFKQYTKEGNEKVIYQCSQELSIVSFDKGQKILQYGEVGSNFYLILIGKVKVYARTEITRNMTQSEYIKFLRDK